MSSIPPAGQGRGNYVCITGTGADLDKPKLENLKAMIDFTREYGVYN